MIKNEVINEAIEYILSNLWGNITLEDVAAHCNLSKFYFSRLFKEETGESVYSFIKRLKMEQSALKLKVEKSRTITDIGLDYGYSASNYSSAFSQYHNISPVLFRKKVDMVIPYSQSIFDEINSKVTIQMLPDYLVVYERAIGNYEDMKDNWCKFVEKYHSYKDENTIYFDRSFDDPTITDENRCIYDICMSIRKDDQDKFTNTCVLKGGKFVVYPFKGVIDDIFQLHQKLIGIWFSHTNYELDDRYSYSLYKKVTSDFYMEFDICIPIK